METEPEKLEARLRLFTAAEVADILKLNAQVVARKLSAREIEGYKIGKDWRVSEEQLVAFLDRHSNKKSSTGPEAKTLRSFLEDGKLKSIPTNHTKRLHVLKHLASQLDAQRVYSEAELNVFLAGYHSDVCTLRRELIINKLMVRKAGKYKRVTWNPL
ncbi:MAG: DUF2087 domain-containing protein [Myxococcaceae bacterium]